MRLRGGESCLGTLKVENTLMHFVSVCTSLDGQLVSLQELWRIVSDTLKLDAASTDWWKLVTQQVCQADT